MTRVSKESWRWYLKDIDTNVHLTALFVLQYRIYAFWNKTVSPFDLRHFSPLHIFNTIDAQQIRQKAITDAFNIVNSDGSLNHKYLHIMPVSKNLVN